jgi:peroxiredoxin
MAVIPKTQEPLVITRRHHHRLALAATALPLIFLSPAAHAASVGQAAPPFELKGVSGKTVRLADFRGKHVVLEWTNPGCPFVVKHYGAQSMQALQKEFTAKGVVWLSVSSMAPGTTEYLAPAALAAKYKAWGASASDLLIDESGAVGKAYAAKTTPHMFVIAADGTLAYQGAIDDNSSADSADIAKATNYVSAALASIKAGTPIKTATTQPYGCFVKY